MTVAVVICAFTERRWGTLRQAVASALRQTRRPDAVVVVVDHNEQLLRRATVELPADVLVVASEDGRGLAGARNTGIRHCSTDVVAFLDDDARADPGWLAELMAPYADARVAGVGGVVEPIWAQGAPAWLPAEFYWTVGCSYLGLPVRPEPIRNPIGANMSFRRRAFELAGGFRTGIGRTGALPLGCEETEFAIRLRRIDPEAVVLHQPSARVEHVVWPERTTWRYFRSRCWSEGRSKALVSSVAGATSALSSERRYVAQTLPAGLARAAFGALHGDAGAARRGCTIVAGLALTAAGYARGRTAAGKGR